MLDPAFGESEWRRSRQEFAECRDVIELRQRLTEKAREMTRLVRGGSDPAEPYDRRQIDREFWKQLGVSLIESDSSHSGGHHESNGGRLIFVRASEHRWRKRFTVAHEIAHLLLDEARSARTDLLDSEKEERLCDHFANELLIPRPELNQVLSDTANLTLELLNTLCRQFRVNLQPMLIALAQTGRFGHFTALLTRRRGHPRRPGEIDYRVEKCPFRGLIFLPKDRRLRSLGLGETVDWASSKDAGQRHAGRAETIELPLWERGRGSGIATGPARWEAQTLARYELIVLIELTELKYQWHNPKTSP
jgi:hypothetical protein